MGKMQMPSFAELLKALSDNPTAVIAVLSLLANGYQYREREKGHSATLDIAKSVLPLAEKLADGVEALERMDARRGV